MALDDFDTHESAEAQVTQTVAAPVAAPVSRPARSEDEDLFDFPVLEMKLEAEVAKKPAAPAVQATPATPPPPAAAKPAAQTAPAAKPAPAKEAAKATSSGVRPQEKKDVAKAAQLVEDIEHVLGSDGKPRKQALRVQGPSPLTLVGIAVLVLTNVFGLLFLWRTSQSVETGVQAMNRRFAESLRLQAQTQSQPGPVTAQAPKSGQHAKPSEPHAPAGLEAFELTALQMAREEIQAGEYSAARQRLARLLAAADRIEVESRAEIEAQASFLLACTYRKQAEAAREKSP